MKLTLLGDRMKNRVDSLFKRPVQIPEKKVSGEAGGMGVAREGEDCQHNLGGAKFPLILPSGYYIMLSV